MMYARFIPFKNRFLLLALLMLAQLNGCKKETLLTPEAAMEAQLAEFKTASGAELVLSSKLEREQNPVAERNDSYTDLSGNAVPEFPDYDGICRLIFRVYAYTAGLPHGGFEPPCPDSEITLRGTTAPNGAGTVLFTQTVAIKSGWQSIIVPETAYITFVISNPNSWGGDCRYKFVTADFGWNKSMFEWNNISRNEVYPVITGRFAPKDPSTNGYFNLYREYYCGPWCTWQASVIYQPSDDPWDNPWTLTRFTFYKGQPPANNYVNENDPRLIKDLFLYEKIYHKLLLYPIEPLGNLTYTSKTINVGNDENDLIEYYILGGTNAAGPFNWGPAGDFQVRPDCELAYFPNQ